MNKCSCGKKIKKQYTKCFKCFNQLKTLIRSLGKYAPVVVSKQHSPKFANKSKRHYYQTSYWKSFKNKIVNNAECIHCGGNVNIVAHHLVYRGMGNEQEGDVVPLCQRCHNLLHQHYETKIRFNMPLNKKEVSRVKYRALAMYDDYLDEHSTS